MSYILDALRKAERDHRVSRVPTLATAHGSADRRPPSWIWPASTGVLAIGVLVAFALHWAPTPPVRREPVPEVTPPATSSAVAHARVQPPAGEVAGPPAEHPADVPAPAGHAITPPASAPHLPPTARVGPDRRHLAGQAGASVPPASKPMAAVAAPPAPSPPIDRTPARVPGTAGGVVAPPTVAAAAPSDTGAGQATPAASAQGLLRLTLDVLVYSDVPAERLVFINGRKYVEGQAVDGNAVVEQITPEGAVLRHEGKQIVLRPKLNPYARPGSP